MIRIFQTNSRQKKKKNELGGGGGGGGGGFLAGRPGNKLAQKKRTGELLEAGADRVGVEFKDDSRPCNAKLAHGDPGAARRIELRGG
jgi:hypothetical protein